MPMPTNGGYRRSIYGQGEKIKIFLIFIILNVSSLAGLAQWVKIEKFGSFIVI